MRRIYLHYSNLAPVDPRCGTIECKDRYLRKRLVEYLCSHSSVKMCGTMRVLGHGRIVFFQAEEGSSADDIVPALKAALPVFIAEMEARSTWVSRNFWLIWGGAAALYFLIGCLDAVIFGGASDIICRWCVGVFIIAFSIWQYRGDAAEEKKRLEQVRSACLDKMKEQAANAAK